MSDAGTFDALADDVAALIEYAGVLVSGRSNAQKNSKGEVVGPLGNKYWLKTIGSCQDKDTGDKVGRYIWINNVPDGNIPFLSALSGVDYQTFEGLIPGAIENVEVLDPITIVESLFEGSTPTCGKINLPTVDGETCTLTESINQMNRTTPSESKGSCWSENYLTYQDAIHMDACEVGPGYCKPAWATDTTYEPQCCDEQFQNMNSNNKKFENKDILKDPFVEFYFIILGLLGLYILLCFLHKSR